MFLRIIARTPILQRISVNYVNIHEISSLTAFSDAVRIKGKNGLGKENIDYFVGVKSYDDAERLIQRITDYIAASAETRPPFFHVNENVSCWPPVEPPPMK
jgi:hypothetical protein